MPAVHAGVWRVWIFANFSLKRILARGRRPRVAPLGIPARSIPSFPRSTPVIPALYPPSFPRKRESCANLARSVIRALPRKKPVIVLVDETGLHDSPRGMVVSVIRGMCGRVNAVPDPLDSRFRGNDGGRIRLQNVGSRNKQESRATNPVSLDRLAGAGLTFRRSGDRASLSESGLAGFSGFHFRPTCVFSITGNPDKTNTNERLPVKDARRASHENPTIP